MLKFNPMQYRMPVLKRLVPSVRKRIARLTWTDGFAIVRSRNARFLVNYRNYVDRQIAFYDDFETEQLEYLLKNIRKFDCSTFIDVGANIGYYSVHVAKNEVVSKLVAFEPDSRNCDQLAANLFLNGLSDRVNVHRVALTNRTGKVTFNAFPDTSTGQSRISLNGVGIEVDAVRLDDVLALKNENVAIKIDVEEHEQSVVEGMRELLVANRCLLQVEVFPKNLSQFRTVLKSFGYRVVHVIEPDHYFTNFP
ncbi:MAG: FkbM family methyltransferase [Stellaceae bacterium]